MSYENDKLVKIEKFAKNGQMALYEVFIQIT